MRHPWGHLNLFNELWLAALITHLVIVLRLRPGKDADSSAS